jgi:formylglycine-generating enzyme required for sulfatase activity
MPDRTKGVDYKALPPKNGRPEGINHLLVIAIDEYEHCPKLGNCVKDAKDLTQLLKERYHFKEEHIHALYNQEASRENILKELKNLRSRVGENDNLLIFFSGHGEVEDNEAYWIPVEGKPGADWDWVPADRIKRQLNAVNSFHTLVIVDACFSGSFFLSYKSATRDLLDSRRSRLGISASHSRERALDGQAGENSPFARELLKVLKYNQEPLPVDKLFTEVRDAVSHATNGRQTPIFKNIDVNGDDQGQFIFDPVVAEADAWKRCEKTDDIVAYQKFIALFPESTHIQKATQRLQQLQEAAVWQQAKKEHSISALLNYKNQYPAGKYKQEARALIAELEDEQHWSDASGRHTISAYLEYMNRHPEGKYATAAREAVAQLGGQSMPLGSANVAPAVGERSANKHTQSPPSRLVDKQTNTKKWAGVIAAGILLIATVFILINRKQEVRYPEELTILDSQLQKAIQSGNLQQVEQVRYEISLLPGGEEVSKKLATIDKWISDRAASLGFPQMIEVEGGTFSMGCQLPRSACSDDELPAHEVQLKSFAIGQYEITNEQYAKFLNAIKEQTEAGQIAAYVQFEADGLGRRSRIILEGGEYQVEEEYASYPVNFVSWQGAKAYASWMSAQTSETYRLPSEAEWEYAARGAQAGISGEELYAGGEKAEEVAWYTENSNNSPQPVGQLKSNKLGIYDLSGNLQEWCEDDYLGDYQNASTNGQAVKVSNNKPIVVRGGSYNDPSQVCRVHNREFAQRNATSHKIGFRLVRE